MARGLAQLAVVLVLLAPTVGAVVPPLETYQTRVALRGYDDALPRVPAAGLRESIFIAPADVPVIPAVPSACLVAENCTTLVPRLQYHWFELLLRDLEGEPMTGVEVPATFRGFEGGADILVLRPDASGFVRALRRPAVEPLVSVELALPDGTRATYWWVVHGATENATAPMVIRSEGRITEARIDILQPGHFWVDQHARVTTKSLEDASVVVADATAYVGNHFVYGIAAYGAFSEPHDAELTVTALELKEHADLPINLTSSAASATFDVRGQLTTAVSFVMRLGHEGDGGDVTLRVFGSPGSYRVTLRDVGNLTVAAPVFTGVRASALDIGLVLASVEASLDVTTPGIVLTDAHVPLLSTARMTIQRDARVVSVDSDLLSETVRYHVDDGACQGSWKVKLSGYLGLIEPSVALAHAENYTLPAWAVGDFPVSGLCA